MVNIVADCKSYGRVIYMLLIGLHSMCFWFPVRILTSTFWFVHVMKLLIQVPGTSGFKIFLIQINASFISMFTFNILT